MRIIDAIGSRPDGIARLTDWALLRAHGADAAAFLQTQLTQDVVDLPAGEVRLAGYCSPKGRLLASFIVWRMADDAFALLCSADVAAAMVKRLSMYVLRARCRIEDVSAAWAPFGVAGSSPLPHTASEHVAWRVQQHEGTWLIGLPAVESIPRWLMLRPLAESGALTLPALDERTWRLLEVASGVPRITAATVEQFVPQMVNFERVGGVHFQKGCYPGQEVVARSQYRGTIKRRMHLFATSGSAKAGQEVFHSGDASQPAGMVVNAADTASGSVLLAEAKLAALEGGTLHLGAADGPSLQRLELPYPITDTAAA
jgi:folate-binding protein YgfZ